MNPTSHSYSISAAMLAALHKEVTSLSSVILTNPLLPILENFLLKIENGHIIIAASDQQTSIISRLPLEGNTLTDTLQIAVPARMFKETLKNLPNQPIHLVIDKERYNMTLQTSNGQYKIACENGDDFPDIFNFTQNQVDITLSSELLQQTIRQTLFAVSKDELRPELTGVYFNLNDEGLSFVSTDGHRLVCYKHKDIQSNQHIACIVPHKALQLVSQLLTGQKEKQVSLSFQDKQLLISWDHIQLIVSLINESYPDYENVIPRSNPHKLTLNTTYLATLKRISIYANRSTQQLRLNIQKDHIKVIAEDLDFSNEAHETVPCQYEGPPMEIGFNAKLLIEMLSIFPPQEDIHLTLDMPNRAVLITPPQTTPQQEIRMLIMPILLNP